jgi:acyl-CoA synthetase (AMP-forming)/AMP-acid ligase II
MITLWRGQHSYALLERLRECWHSQELLIVCPPTLNECAFVDALPEGKIALAGEGAEGFPVALRERVARPRPVGALYPERPVLGVFTSGTISGRPRLVLYSRANILRSLEGIRSFFDPINFDEIFCYPPSFHTFGLILGYLHAIVYGLKLTVHEGRYSRAAHELRARNTNPRLLTLGAPSHFYDLVGESESLGRALVPTDSCILGGARVPVTLWEQVQSRLHIARPSIGYGATEACPGVTHQPPGLKPREEGEIGRALPGVGIRLHPDGIEFSGNVCLAIIDGGELTFPQSITLPDLVEQRGEDGIYLFRGRLGLTLNRGGTKFSLESLEDVLRRELGIFAAAFVVADERLGEDLGLRVERVTLPAALATCSPEELRQRCAKILHVQGATFELPVFELVDRIRLNENGKIERRPSHANERQSGRFRGSGS